jgi:hypothetical protein
MSKLDIRMTGLALIGGLSCPTGGAYMPTHPTPKKRRQDDLACVYPNAAGLDIGSAEIVVAVPPDRDPEPVRVFPTFTPDLHALAAWLVACGIDTVAMESTGVFWIPIDELLEQHGIVPYLVNARHVKAVPGRKTDWNDAQWLQKLHALGLLQASFRPDAEIRTLRTLVRYRAELIERRAPHINHMIQALKHMNIQLNLVLTDITGVTGLAMLRAIIAGERDPQRLAQFRQPGCKHSEAEIVKALTGTRDDATSSCCTRLLICLITTPPRLLNVIRSWSSSTKPWSRAGRGMRHCRICPAKPDSKSKNALTFNARADRTCDWRRLSMHHPLANSANGCLLVSSERSAQDRP